MALSLIHICAPSASAAVEYVATPEPFSMPVPSAVAPSIKVTMPVGTPLPGFSVTVAVKVTFAPTAGFVELAINAVEVCAKATVTVTAADVLPELFVSPPYTAVIECGPIASAAVANVATPAPFSVPVPSTLAPSMNVTDPVGTPLPGFCVTVAVKVTLVPTFKLVALAIRAVAVCARLTVTVTAADVLPELFVSPPYTAVIECDPIASVAVVKVATPVAFSVPVPSVADPSMNVTVPVGVVPPDGGVTVAVNITLVLTVTLVALATSDVPLPAELTVTKLAPVAFVYVSAPAVSGV